MIGEMDIRGGSADGNPHAFVGIPDRTVTQGYVPRLAERTLNTRVR
jgi:hypothetical protein